MSQSDFNEILLPKPEYPEAWECCGSECGDYCVYEIYRRDKIDYDAQQKRLKEFLDKKQLNDLLFYLINGGDGETRTLTPCGAGT